MKKNQETNQNVTKYSHKALEVIEKNRIDLYSSYKKHNSLKFVVTVICLIAILVAFILIPSLNLGGLGTTLTVVIAIVALALTYGYSVYVRKKFDRRMKDYFNVYFECINEYALEGKEFSKIELQNPGKITLEEFNECLLYKDVVEAGSRGLTNFKYKKLDLSIVDCAGNVKAEKRMKPVFVGKMVRSKASYKGDKPILIYIKGNDRALPPTNLEGVKNVLDDSKMAIYSDSKTWKKVITGPVMKALGAIKTEKILVDVAISIYGGKVYVMMGYDDPLMVLPLQEEFNPAPTEKYKKDIKAVAALVEALNK